jgi:hypothetical protein
MNRRFTGMEKQLDRLENVTMDMYLQIARRNKAIGEGQTLTREILATRSAHECAIDDLVRRVKHLEEKTS